MQSAADPIEALIAAGKASAQVRAPRSWAAGAPVELSRGLDELLEETSGDAAI